MQVGAQSNMKVYPLHPHPALLIEDSEESGAKRYIAISDLHIGFEFRLKSMGITIALDHVKEMLDELEVLVKSCGKIDGIILLGDIKHTVGSITSQEWKDIPRFFERLVSKAQVYLVPGNHDSNIRFLLPEEVHAISSKGMVIGDTLFVHGHTAPAEINQNIKRIVMGHVHPVFLKDGSVINGERVWVYLRVKKESIFAEEGMLDIIIVPSFNRFLYATGHGAIYRKSISPIITRAIHDEFLQQAMVLTLDGAIVGDATAAKSILV